MYHTVTVTLALLFCAGARTPKVTVARPAGGIHPEVDQALDLATVCSTGIVAIASERSSENFFLA